MHTYIPDHMHEVVAGSGGNTIDLGLLSTGVNEEYIKVLVSLKYSTKQIDEHYLHLTERKPHIPKSMPPTN